MLPLPASPMVHLGGARRRGAGPGRSSTDKARTKELELEVKEFRTANEILKRASAYFA